MDDECTTWRQLRDKINAMPEDRLDDAIQTILKTDDEPVPLGYAFGFATVGYYMTCGDGAVVRTRGSVDNEDHPEHYVLLTSENPFDEDGNFYYTETAEGMIGNKTGKNYGPGLLGMFEGDRDAT